MFVIYTSDFPTRKSPSVSQKKINDKVHVFTIDTNIPRATKTEEKNAFSRLIFFSVTEAKSTESSPDFSVSLHFTPLNYNALIRVK